MTVYRVIMNRVRDADGYAAFAKVASAALARHGGEIVARCDDGSDRIMIQRFPDAAAVRAHYCDPELQDALAASAGSFTRDVIVRERTS